MKNIYLLLLLFSFAFSPLMAIAQEDTNTEQTTEVNKNGKIPVTQRDYENTEVSMADTFRADGKIYVVVAVLATIFAGIVVFLVVTESKLKKLEDLVYSERASKEKV
ncbi:CcmD family protein [Bernardetia sp. Wsw4-3y2]|uniref:CcmD family protein n=1 Tax=Bernardetia sp. Wsw4-3y2 TaxID=3127471 RepID=UPI0030CB80D2